jgi:hypothetical protein
MTGRSGGTVHAMRPEQCLIEMDALASGRSIPMLRKTMIVLATAAALTGGLTADAFARGGGGGGHMGGGFRPGQHFAGARGRFGFGGDDYGLYDFACDYGSPYYNPYTGTCYPN